jgi:hypothetical protein
MKKLILLISIAGLMFFGCSDDDNPAASSTGTFTEGTYNMTGATMYDTEACSGTGTALPVSSGCCYDNDIDECTDATTEATCTDGVWEDESAWSLIFGANGVLTDPDNEGTHTYTVDGTTITVVIAGECHDGQNTTEAACTEGSWDDAETETATLNADGTISIDMSYPGECHDGQNTTEAACTEGSWEDAGCTTVVFTLSTD